MAQIEINIDNYLSEEEKKELAINVFKDQIKKELFNSQDGTVQADSEIQRIIGNISHSVIVDEVSKYIPDYEKMIKEKVTASLNEKNLSYQIFNKKDAWGGKDSLAITYIQETIKAEKNNFQQRIKDTISNYDFSADISNKISDEFDNIAATIYKLAELFHKD